MKVGFVGLGNMGNPMATNLVRAGHQLTVHDLRREAATNLLEMGAEWADTPSECVPGNDVVFTSLPGPRDVEAVVLGENGILEGAQAGDVYMDLSTNSPTTIRRIHDVCAEQGVNVMDSPVSGGVYGAAAATLAVMVGGDEAVFDDCKAVLDVVGGNVVLTGDVGAGNITKLANQIIVAANIEALSEAMVLAQKAGVDPERVFNAIRGGLAGSAVMEAKAPMMLDRNFRAGFRIRLHQKDLRNVLQTAGELNVPLPVTALVQQMLGSLINDGEQEADHAAILHFIEKLAGVEVNRGG